TRPAKGGHVIKLGPGNDMAARSALAAYPKGLQIGGGINLDNAQAWLDAGASHVIITSILFNQQGEFQQGLLDQLVERIGQQQLVIDLSCQRTTSGWTVAMNRWQTLTNLELTPHTLDQLASQCDEFLIHAADVEGLCQGIDQELVTMLGQWRGCPCTYAGGINKLSDFELIDQLSAGQVDATVGSALDIFGGSSVNYAELVAQRA
ncbi:MAG: phosphoribosylformimino-5-aminoimidazole carboxamide ribotide isomerase, partial [Akkermansia sp.]